MLRIIRSKETAKLQWLQDPSEINGDNLKDKINEHATNSTNKNMRDLYRGINKFKGSYKSRNNLLNGENGDLLADSHNILISWKNYFSQLLSVHNVS
jgi:hypothetical protein